VVWIADMSSPSMIYSYFSSRYIEICELETSNEEALAVAPKTNKQTNKHRNLSDCYVSDVHRWTSLCLFVCLFVCFSLLRSMREPIYKMEMHMEREAKCVYISHTKCNLRNLKPKLLVYI